MFGQKGQERWAPVAGYEQLYEVSDHGRVRSHGRWCRGRADSRRWQDGRILKTPLSHESGYPACVLARDAGRQNAQVHRLVAAAFVSGWFDGAHVNHIDANKANNHWTNLEWVTPAQNMLHAYKNGLTHYHTEEFVRALCADRARGMKLKELSAKYDVPIATACKIASGERYRWIERPSPLTHYDHPGRIRYRCIGRDYDSWGTSTSFWIEVPRRNLIAKRKPSLAQPEAPGSCHEPTPTRPP